MRLVVDPGGEPGASSVWGCEDEQDLFPGRCVAKFVGHSCMRCTQQSLEDCIRSPWPPANTASRDPCAYLARCCGTGVLLALQLPLALVASTRNLSHVTSSPRWTLYSLHWGVHIRIRIRAMRDGPPEERRNSAPDLV